MTMLDDWPRVKAVFEQALAVDETERPAFLAAACGSDVQLRERVDALLASHAASDSFLETGASSVLRLPPSGEVPEDLSGQRLGRHERDSADEAPDVGNDARAGHCTDPAQIGEAEHCLGAASRKNV